MSTNKQLQNINNSFKDSTVSYNQRQVEIKHNDTHQKYDTILNKNSYTKHTP